MKRYIRFTTDRTSYTTTIDGISITITPRYSMGFEDGYDVFGEYPDGSNAGHKYYDMRDRGENRYDANGFNKERTMHDLARLFIKDIGWDNKMRMD